MITNDISQCKNCIYHYTYNGKDMCKQVGDDFYLQWKVEDCPYHTTITSATKISDEIYCLRAENAALRERLEKAEKEIDEYKRKIEYGKLVEPVWFISFMNDLPCYGRVIGYQEDSGFVMQCSDCMISAKKIYLSEEEAEKELKGECKK